MSENGARKRQPVNELAEMQRKISELEKKLHESVEKYNLGRRAEAELRHRAKLQSLITNLSTEFINLEPKEIDRAINKTLKTIGKFARVDRSYLFQFSHDDTTMDNTAEWCDKGIKPHIEQLKGIPLDAFSWSTNRIRNNEIVHIPSVRDLPPEAKAEKKEFEREKIQSLVFVPMILKKRVIGFIGFDSVRSEKTWPEEFVSLLRIVGNQLAHALERKHVEGELKEREERLQLIFEYAPDAYYLSDLKGTFIDGNKAAEELTKYKKEELIGKSFLKLKLLSTDQIPKAAALLAKNALGRATGPDEFTMTCKDGSKVNVEIRTYPVKIKTKFLVLGIARDITERIESEKQLRILSSVVEQSENSIAVLDPDGIVEYANPKMLQLNQFSPESVTGKHWRTFVSEHSSLRMKYDEIAETVLKRGESWKGEVTDLDEKGRPVWRYAAIFPIKNSRGKVVHTVYMSEDITEQKLAQEQIKASLKEKEVLLKEVHHRVKNNMQVISSLLGLQISTLGDDKLAEILKESQSRIRAMAQIHEKIYQSQDLSRIDFYDYVQGLTKKLHQSYSQNPGIALQTSCENVFLSADTAIPCGLIINELVTNSLTHAFSRDDTGEISVSIHSDNNDYVLEVSDNGSGFPAGIDFRNTDSLGLRLVTILVSQIDGHIDLDSSNGTKFTIKFSDTASTQASS